MNLSSAYVSVLPRIDTAAPAAMERAARTAGEAAGKAVSQGIQKTLQRERDANGRFVKRSLDKTEEIAEDAGTKAGKGFVRQMGQEMNRAVGPSFKKYFGFGPKAAEDSGKQSGGLFKRAFSGAIAGLGTAIVAAGVFDFFKSSISAASDLNETMNKMRTIFKSNAGAIEAWSKDSATAFGLSQEAALASVSTFGLMFKQLGFTGEQTVKMSEGVVQLAADLGSFHNLQTDDVLERISAALRGEYDSLQLLVPTINAARVEQKALELSGKSSTAALTDQDKATAALAIITESSTDAIGDFAKTADGLANKSKTATSKIEDLKAKIGEQLQPVMLSIYETLSEKVLPALSDFVAGLTGGPLGDDTVTMQAAEDAGYAAGEFTTASDATSDWYTNGKKLKGVLEDISGAIEDIGTAYSSNKGFWNAIAGIAGTVVALKGTASAISGITTAIRPLIAIFSGIATGTGIALGAIGALAGAFAIIAGAAIYSEDTMQSVKDFLNSQGWIPGWIKNLWFAFINVGQGIKNVFQELGNWFSFWFTKLKTAWDEFKIKLLVFKNWAERIFAVGVIAVFVFLKNQVVGAWNGITSGIGRAWDGIKGIFNTVKEWVTVKIPGWFRSLGDKIGGVFTGVRNSIRGTWDSILNSGRSAINGMGRFINNIIRAVNKIPFVKLSLLAEPLVKGGGSIAGRFAAGGAVHGGPPGVDTVAAMGRNGANYLLDNGEHILTREEVKKMGGQAAVYAFRSKIRKGEPVKMKDGGNVLNPSGYYPGMGRNVGNVPGLVALYRHLGGRGGMTSGYRAGDPLWHGSGLAADFGGYNQDRVAGNLMKYSSFLLELIHQTNLGTYNVTRGQRVRMDGQTNAEHRNHVHLAASPQAVAAITGGKVAPGPGGGMVDWVLSIAGKAARKLLGTAIDGLKGVLPQGDGLMPSAIRGLGTGIPSAALKYFDSKAGSGQTATFQGPKPRGMGSVYDSGGWLNPGQVGINLSNRPEAVLTAEESDGLKALGAGQLLDKLDEVIDAVNSVAPGVADGLTGTARNARMRR